MSYQPDAQPGYDNRLEVVVVCRDYADFLAQTLPFNIAHVDRLVVVTSHDDTATKSVCQKWSVECVVTDAFTEKGDAFNKGSAVNIGIQSLRQRGWILQLDADIVLPSTFRNMLDKSALHRDCIYGCERANVNGWEKWEHLKRCHYHEEPQFGYNYLVTTPAEYPIGANLIHKQRGYCPIGFFQLWHSSFMHKHDLRYPETEGSAENMDVQWALRWPRSQRLLLPTVRVFHLESQVAAMGINWKGRKSKPFTHDGQPLVAPTPSGYSYRG